MRIGMHIDANVYQSVNAQIRIECALPVLCEQALSERTATHRAIFVRVSIAVWFDVTRCFFFF